MTTNQEVIVKMYQIQLTEQGRLIEDLQRENTMLKSQLEKSFKGYKSSQIARLFLPKILWK